MRGVLFALALVSGVGLAGQKAEASFSCDQILDADRTVSLSDSGGSVKLCGTLSNVFAGTTAATVFRGIPYASAGRFQPAEPMLATSIPAYFGQSKSTTVPVKTFGSACLQFNGSLGSSEALGSEDCLFLNVWTPNLSSAAKLPVLVFIHGGAFVFGSGTAPFFDGATLSGPYKTAGNQGHVVVTLNYRLGPLGFLAAQGSDAGKTPIGGNLGITDQQAALQWVQKYIGQFGGDANNVTVFGESAGAMSAGIHLFSTAPAASTTDFPEGEFKAVIMESNPFGYVYPTLADAGASTGNGWTFITNLCELIKAAGGSKTCDIPNKDISAIFDTTVATTDMVALAWKQTSGDPLEQLTNLATMGLPAVLPWTPVYDSTLVKAQPLAGFSENQTVKPFLFGTNHDEGLLFGDGAITGIVKASVMADPASADAKLTSGTAVGFYDSLLHSLFTPADVDTITGYTPDNGQTHPYKAPVGATPGQVAATMSQMITDFAFRCANFKAAGNATISGKLSGGLYSYVFKQSSDFQVFPNFAACGPGSGTSCHGSEMPFVFGTLGIQNITSTTDKNATTVSGAMVTDWQAFASGRAPASNGFSAWDPNNAGTSTFTYTASDVGTVDYDAQSNCTGLWYGILDHLVTPPSK